MAKTRRRSNSREDRAYRKRTAAEAAGKLTPLQQAERRLAEAVKSYRKRGDLHDGSPDGALVAFAFDKGSELTGADGVREAFKALEAARLEDAAAVDSMMDATTTPTSRRSSRGNPVK